MDALYVCLFSNGHIKVGRSADPASRIAAHADRVACIGVELSEQFTVECSGPSVPRETALIQRCTEHAERRFQSEWFAGLNFLTVCEWAAQIASSDHEDVQRNESGFGARLREARAAAGLTQAQLGRGLATGGGDLLKAAVSSWECDRSGPNITQLRAVCERLNVSADFLIGMVPAVASKARA